jgi:hypothetical protein
VAVKITTEGVPLDTLIDVVKASVTRAGISRTSEAPDFRIASVQLTLKVVAGSTAGGGLDFRVPFIGMKLKLGASVTRSDTHTIDITLAPPKDPGRLVRGGEDVEEALVNAVAAIRAVTTKAASGDDPWIMSESTIDISFAITQTGTISLGVDGELSGELTHTLRLRLAPGAATEKDAAA